MDRPHRALMLLMLMAGFLLSCGDGHHAQTSPTAATDAPELEGHGTIRLNVSYAPWGPEAAKIADLQAIDGATVYVYASDGAEIVRQQLTLSEGRATGELTVRSAQGLRVVLVFHDGEVVRYIGADDEVDVTIGGETTADLVCHYLGTWVRAPEITGVNRPYTVSWASRPHATGYELQEATTSDFSEPAHLYEGPALSHQVSGKPEVGVTHYYRARAGTGYGVGPWHSAGAAAVEISKPEGKIVIDVAIPPDEPDEPDARPEGAGYALALDGDGDAVRVAGMPSIVAPFSVEAWVKPADREVANVGDGIVSRENDFRGFILGWLADQFIGILNGNEQGFYDSFGLAGKDVNRWYHVALTWDGAERRLYVDGNPENERAGSYVSDVGDLYIGSWIGERYLNGLIDEVRIWGVAVSQADIQARMRSSLSGYEPGLMAYWRFDELDGDGRVPDSGPGGHYGTLLGDAHLVPSDAPMGSK